MERVQWLERLDSTGPYSAAEGCGLYPTIKQLLEQDAAEAKTRCVITFAAQAGVWDIRRLSDLRDVTSTSHPCVIIAGHVPFHGQGASSIYIYIYIYIYASIHCPGRHGHQSLASAQLTPLAAHSTPAHSYVLYVPAGGGRGGACRTCITLPTRSSGGSGTIGRGTLASGRQTEAVSFRTLPMTRRLSRWAPLHQ
eukprot:1179319-Prorocentrum_minimum.AAC.6